MMKETRDSYCVRNGRTGEECKLAMQELWLTGRVLPLGARLFVRHVFCSGESKPMEMIYAFGLPKDASLRRFKVTGTSFSVESELKKTQDAVQEYERGLEQGHLAVMARQYRDGVINLTLGNVQPDEEVVVLLEMVAGVQIEDDGYRFRFPFTLAPTYHAQARAIQNEQGIGELELPDEFGDVILPVWSRDSAALHRVGFDLSVETSGNLSEVSSPSHAVQVQHTDKGLFRVALAREGDIPNRDLILDVRVKEKNPLIRAGKASEGDFRIAAVIPSSQFGEATHELRRVAFVLDRSGSMGGTPIEQAKKALEVCIGALGVSDQFAIVTFDNSLEVFEERLREVTVESRDAARQFLSRVDARGGTELFGALHKAVEILGRAGGDILVLTDGQVAGTDSGIAGIRDKGIHVHCLGIGSASQDRFLSLLASQTGGKSVFLSPSERVDRPTLELFGSIGGRIGSDLEVKFEGADGVLTAPEVSGFISAGQPITIFASASSLQDNAQLILSWKGADGSKTLTFPISVSEDGDGKLLKLIQGARLITEAEIDLGLRRDRDEVMQRLKALSSEYQLASQAMALVAVVKRAGDRPGEQPKTMVVRVGMPEDVRFDAYFRQPARRFTPTRPICCPTHPDVQKQESRLDFSRAVFAPQMMKRYDSEPDLCMELSLLVTDSGIPGRDIEESVLATALAALLFCEENVAVDHGPLGVYLRRMVEFLESVQEDALSAAVNDIRKRVLEIIAQRLPTPVGKWEELCQHFIVRKRMSKNQVIKETLRSLLES